MKMSAPASFCSMSQYRNSGARDSLCGENALQGLLASTVPHENGDAVFRRMERQDVFRSRKHPRKEWRRIRHELSRGAR